MPDGYQPRQLFTLHLHEYTLTLELTLLLALPASAVTKLGADRPRLHPSAYGELCQATVMDTHLLGLETWGTKEFEFGGKLKEPSKKRQMLNSMPM